jgi:hypothetical protein
MTLKEHSVSLRNTVNINGVLNYLKQLCDPTNHSLSRIVVIFHLISGYIHYEVITETSQLFYFDKESGELSRILRMDFSREIPGSNYSGSN